ncbi:MAG: fumarate reductase subunit C [Panacagrimonas sp.]
MAGWWRRNPFYLWYMLREASCVFITLYALVLLWGLARLAQGRGAYEAWLASLSSPGAILFHAVAFALVLYHAWTWFKVMPRTMPFLRIGGRRVPDGLIVAFACACSIVLSCALLIAVWRL